MRERLITLLTGLSALAIMYVLFSSQHQNLNKPISLPTSEDRGSDGLKGLFSWLQREQISVLSLRKPLSQLNRDLSIPPGGNVLILSLPLPAKLMANEQQDLVTWVEKGNTLMILGAAYLHPPWAKLDNCFCDAKGILEHFHWTLSKPEDQDNKKPHKTKQTDTFKNKINNFREALKQQLPQDSQFVSASAASVLVGIELVNTATQADLLKQPWNLSTNTDENQGQVLLKTIDSGLPGAWQMKAGAGRIVLFMTADLFSNARLAYAGNAGLLSNLVGQTLAPNAKVIFDDFHFGLSELYNPNHFFKDPRLHQSLAGLGILWLFYLIGYSTRLAPVRIAAGKLSAKDYIDVTANFFARRINKRQLAEALVKHLLTDISISRRLNSEAETWQWLAKHSRISEKQLELLKQAQAKQTISLLRLSNTINYIRTVTL